MEGIVSWRKAILSLGILLFLGTGLLLGLYTAPTVIIEGSTELLYMPDLIYGPQNVLANLQTGERGKLLWSRYSKDAKFYKIYLGDGRCGYIMDGGNFRFASSEADKAP